MKFNERLKELRITSPYTQKQLAEMLGISEVAYQNYEYGKREPRLKSLIALADIFHVTLDYLVGRDFPEVSSDEH